MSILSVVSFRDTGIAVRSTWYPVHIALLYIATCIILWPRMCTITMYKEYKILYSAKFLRGIIIYFLKMCRPMLLAIIVTAS